MSMSLASHMSANAEDTRNDAALEALWASKAFAHAETYMRLLTLLKGRLGSLKLTKVDDQIYKHFRETFPDLRVDVWDEDVSKTPEMKNKWRAFMEAYNDEIVKEFNMATLMRIDASKACDEHNTCIVPRIQFFAVEIARTREGHNNNPVE